MRKEEEGEIRTMWDALVDGARSRQRKAKKVMLVMDEPMDCTDCPLTDLSSMTGDKLCLAANMKWIETQNVGKKPEWCPLRDIPMKKNTDFSSNVVYANGWNACVDEIRGEE